MSYQSMSQDFTATGTGDVLDMTLSPQNIYALQVVVPSGTPVGWTVSLQISLDGVNWENVLTHTKLLNSFSINFATDTPKPSNYMRFNVTGLSLGSSPKITAYALAMD